MSPDCLSRETDFVVVVWLLWFETCKYEPLTLLQGHSAGFWTHHVQPEKPAREKLPLTLSLFLERPEKGAFGPQ